MLKIETVLCRAGTMNNYSYIIYSDDNKICAVIDPSEAAPIIQRLEQLGLQPQYIFNTHHHFDHTDANLELKNKYHAQVVGNLNDSERIPAFDMGVKADNYYLLSPQGIKLIRKSDNESKASPLLFQVIDVSAHTQGHILYYFPNAKALFTGDTLFNLCIGGLFEGTPEQMFTALNKIRTLPDDTLFYPGHEYTFGGAHDAYQYCNGNQAIQDYLNKAQTRLQQGLPAGPYTLKEEKICNPYLARDSLAKFVALFH